jgi:hypothetical protein
MSAILRRDLGICGLGVLIGWAASRMVIPSPSLAFVSPRFECSGRYQVTVPFGTNVRWAVQSGTGAGFWDPRSASWSRVTNWHAGPGKIIAGPAPEGVRLVVQGFGPAANVAGASIVAVQ